MSKRYIWDAILESLTILASEAEAEKAEERVCVKAVAMRDMTKAMIPLLEGGEPDDCLQTLTLMVALMLLLAKEDHIREVLDALTTEASQHREVIKDICRADAMKETLSGENQSV